MSYQTTSNCCPLGPHHEQQIRDGLGRCAQLQMELDRARAAGVPTGELQAQLNSCRATLSGLKSAYFPGTE